MTAKGNLLSDIIDKELERVGSYRQSVGRDTAPGELNALSHALTNLEHSLREKMQEETRADMAKIINALERDGDLRPQDKELIRTWMVGDAESYLQVENNFGDWTAELNRLLDVIAAARGKTLSPAQMTELQASVRDALRTAADIRFYQEQNVRVKRFRDATADWSRDDKKILARMLRSKLDSHEG
ncbi:MAG: hypothetical protein ACLFWF_08175 [Alphaproteobacteria bacterium]